MAPVSSPPPGNLDPAWAAQSNLARILGITGAFHFLALVSVVLRLYVRIGLLRTPGKDDVAIIAAYLCALGGYICFVLQGYHGLGRHTLTLSQADFKEFERLIFVQGIVSAIGALGFLKISIAFFLLRLAKTGQKWYSRSLWAIIVFVCLYTIVAWLTFLLRCQPMAGFWDRSIQATCWSMHTFIKVAQVNTSFNIVTDVFFAILPIPIVWRLHMSRQTRINIIIVLSLGYIAVALGIVKAVYQVALRKNTDRHFDQHIQFWGFLQLNVGIVAASIPTLKPLLKGGRSPSNANRNPRAGALAQVRESTVKTKPSRTGWSFLQRRPALPPGARSYDLSNPNQMAQPNAKQLYSTSDDERTNSEAEMVQAGGADAKAVTCMTEVVVDSKTKHEMSR